MKEKRVLLSTIIEEAKEHKEEILKLAVFLGVLTVAISSHLIAALGFSLSFMVALDHRKDIKESFNFFFLPVKLLRRETVIKKESPLSEQNIEDIQEGTATERHPQ